MNSSSSEILENKDIGDSLESDEVNSLRVVDPVSHLNWDPREGYTSPSSLGSRDSIENLSSTSNSNSKNNKEVVNLDNLLQQRLKIGGKVGRPRKKSQTLFLFRDQGSQVNI